MPPEVAEVILPAWPKVLKACPGLARYWGDMTFLDTEDNRPYAQPDAFRITVRFKVGNDPKAIPPGFGANGHICSFEVSPDGSTLTVPKLGCASVCLGMYAEPHIPIRSRVLSLPLRAN